MRIAYASYHREDLLLATPSSRSLETDFNQMRGEDSLSLKSCQKDKEVSFLIAQVVSQR